jgi:hypothetical protein
MDRQAALDHAMGCLNEILQAAATQVAGLKTVGIPPNRRNTLDPTVRRLLAERRRYFTEQLLPRLRSGTLTDAQRARWNEFRLEIVSADSHALNRSLDRRVKDIEHDKEGRGLHVLLAIRRRCARTKPGVPATPEGAEALRTHFTKSSLASLGNQPRRTSQPTERYSTMTHAHWRRAPSPSHA